MKKKTMVMFLLCAILCSVPQISVSANSYVPYKTFTYPALHQYNSEMPHLYLPDRIYSGDSLGVGVFLEASDILVDKESNIYIADTGNNRILRFDRDFNLQLEVSTFVKNDSEDMLNTPKGIGVSTTGNLYIADTGNHRIVELTATGEFVRELGAPVSSMLPEGYVYNPIAISIDSAQRIYVVAENVNQGIIQLSSQGDFEGFMGAQKVAYNPIDYIWKQRMTKEQRARMRSFVPTEYNNITIDSEGFLYATTTALNTGELMADIMNPSKTPKTSPIRRLNPSGDDVLRRTGNMAIVGDLTFKNNPSLIRDVALGEAGTYTLMDAEKQRFFTYSAEGELIGAFGGYGKQNGNTLDVSAITYLGSDFLALDKKTGEIIQYKRTLFGDTIIEALEKYNDYDFDESVVLWKQVLEQDGSYDLAFLNIGKSYLRKEDYAKAKEYFKLSLDAKNYSIAFKEQRNLWIERNIGFVFVGLIIGLFLICKLFAFLSEVNKGVYYKRYHQRVLNQFIYGFYIMFHPFDGFWDLKHEKRGSLAAANIILGLAFLNILIRNMFTSFMYAPNAYYYVVNVWYLVSLVAFPLILWVTSNWCFTSLMDGKGTYREIYIATGYAALPYALLGILSTALTHFFCLEERVFVDMANTLGLFWMGCLIFFGSLVTHQYTLLKSIISAVLTFAGIGVIIFLVLVFGGTVSEIITFVSEIIRELMLRG